MKNYLLLFAKGMAMGAADVVPGVSGGTVAFITGIYDELLRSLGSVPNAALQLARGRIGEAWRMVNASFLLVLLTGIGCSVLSLAGVITWLLEHQPIPVWSFFFGLILVSSHLIARQVQRWNWTRVGAFALGALLAWWITVAVPIQWGHDPLSLFIAGAIAICAMILPGISGSFLLVLMGLYSHVLGAVKDLDLAVLAVFAAGCLVGILSFARALSWLLRRWRDLTLSFLMGLMLGSLNKVWPWKQTLEWRSNSAGEQVPLVEQNLLPGHFAELTGHDPQLVLALLLAVAGVTLVLLLEWLAARLSAMPAR